MSSWHTEGFCRALDSILPGTDPCGLVKKVREPVLVHLGDWLKSKIARKVVNDGLPIQREVPRIHAGSLSEGTDGLQEFLPKQIITRLRYTLCIGKASEGRVEGMWRIEKCLVSPPVLAGAKSVCN